jgi:hypothetical protein
VLNTNAAGYDTVIRDISGLAVAVTTAPNRLLKLSAYVLYSTTSAGTWGQFYITKADNTQLQSSAGVPGGVSGSLTPFVIYTTGGAETALSVKVRGHCGAGNLTVNGGGGPAWLTVEDVGPAGAPA